MAKREPSMEAGIAKPELSTGVEAEAEVAKIESSVGSSSSSSSEAGMELSMEAEMAKLEEVWRMEEENRRQMEEASMRQIEEEERRMREMEEELEREELLMALDQASRAAAAPPPPSAPAAELRTPHEPLPLEAVLEDASSQDVDAVDDAEACWDGQFAAAAAAAGSPDTDEKGPAALGEDLSFNEPMVGSRASGSGLLGVTGGTRLQALEPEERWDGQRARQLQEPEPDADDADDDQPFADDAELEEVREAEDPFAPPSDSPRLPPETMSTAVRPGAQLLLRHSSPASSSESSFATSTASRSSTSGVPKRGTALCPFSLPPSLPAFQMHPPCRFSVPLQRRCARSLPCSTRTGTG